jgi:hypothetical protein
LRFLFCHGWVDGQAELLLCYCYLTNKEIVPNKDDAGISIKYAQEALQLIANVKLDGLLPKGMKSAAKPKGSAPQDKEFDDNLSMLIRIVHILVAACVQILVLQSAIA